MSASVCLKVFPRIYKNCGVGRQLPAALPGGSTLALQSLLESGSANVWEQELSPPSHPVLLLYLFPISPSSKLPPAPLELLWGCMARARAAGWTARQSHRWLGQGLLVSPGALSRHRAPALFR